MISRLLEWLHPCRLDLRVIRPAVVLPPMGDATFLRMVDLARVPRDESNLALRPGATHLLGFGLHGSDYIPHGYGHARNMFTRVDRWVIVRSVRGRARQREPKEDTMKEIAHARTPEASARCRIGPGSCHDCAMCCPHGNLVRNSAGKFVPCGSDVFDEKGNIKLCGDCREDQKQ